MPKRSQVAIHPKRAEIEIGLALGAKPGMLAKKYGIHPAALYRYRKDMPPSRKAAILSAHAEPGVDLDKLRTIESRGLLAHLITQRARIHEALDLAQEYGDLTHWNRFEAAMTRNLELTAKLLGELGAGVLTINRQTVVLAGHPDYLQLRHSLMNALARYPKARRAVLVALRQVETDQPAIECEDESTRP